MASFGVNQADQYGGPGGGGYFSLKNDKDTARVRFLYGGIEDVIGYSVHEVEVNGKKRYVNCLREYGDPMDACPMCKNGSPVRAKYFVPIFNLDTGEQVIWERGKKFGQKLSALCSRYPNLVSHRFEIERNGQAGSKDTSYEIYPLQDVPEDAELTMGDFEVEPVLGGLVLNKNAEEMEAYIKRGAFPDKGAQQLPRRSTGGDLPWDTPRRTPSERSGGVF